MVLSWRAMFDQLPSPCSATRLQEKGGKTTEEQASVKKPRQA